VLTDKEGNPIRYVIERKVDNNELYKYLKKQYEDAKEEMYRILKVKDRKAFDYWLKSESIELTYHTSSTDTIRAIKNFERIIDKYQYDKEFRIFIDKIKE